MSPLRLHGVLRRFRRSVAAIAVVCVLGGVVAVEHSALSGMHAPAVAVMCLAVLPGAALLVRRASLLHGPTWVRLARAPRPELVFIPAPRAALARAGPVRRLILRL